MLDQELRGCCQDGYTPEKFQRVMRSVLDATGVRLCCVWAYFDEWGYGGDSEFYIEESDRLFDLTGDLWPWLSALDGDPDAPKKPGDPRTWKGPMNAMALADLAGDGFGNYALETR
ncbi:hypothetical protein BKG82_26985 [Mycobacteroides chelonae]|uniref:Uncharacterized protein n=1 Tax=Mycobacteroides chelonae TaxID=1774 RepID=A0A1S1LHN0_MYCCH|nr:hypothetical protein BKG82_26985 [Mycobacteroides chelonae]